MGDLGNTWDINDFQNARQAWIAQQGKSHKQVRVWKFDGYDSQDSANPNEAIRQVKYQMRLDHVWLSQVKVFDTVKGGYFTTGDLDVYSEFLLQGFSAAYTLLDGTLVPEYAGDIIEWNGKLWEVADQLEPVTWGYLAKQVFYRTVLRRTQRSGLGSSAGP